MAILLRSRAHYSSVRNERCDRDSYLFINRSKWAGSVGLRGNQAKIWLDMSSSRVAGAAETWIQNDVGIKHCILFQYCVYCPLNPRANAIVFNTESIDIP